MPALAGRGLARPQVRSPLWWRERSLHGRSPRPPPQWRPGSLDWRGGREAGWRRTVWDCEERQRTTTRSNVSHLPGRNKISVWWQEESQSHLRSGRLAPPSPEQVVVTTWRPRLHRLIQLWIGGGKCWNWSHSLNRNNFGQLMGHVGGQRQTYMKGPGPSGKTVRKGLTISLAGSKLWRLGEFPKFVSTLVGK